MNVVDVFLSLSFAVLALGQTYLVSRVYRHLDQIDELLSLISSGYKKAVEEAEEEASHE